MFGPLVEVFLKKGYDFQTWAGRTSGAENTELKNNSQRYVKYHGLKNNWKKNVPQRIISYFTFSFSVFIHLLFFSKEGHVIAVTNPPFLPIILWSASRIRLFHYSLVILDLYPDGLEKVGLIQASGTISKVWSYLNRRAFLKAESISVLGRDMKNYLIKKYSIPANKIYWVPHWCAHKSSSVLPIKGNPFVAKYKLENKWIVQYSGNMGLWHDIQNIVGAASILRENKNICFLMAGNGIRKSPAKEMSDRLGLSNIKWINSVPLDELDQLLAACHVSLISQRDNLVGLAVPCKLYGILASGRPVLAAVPKHCEVALVVNEEKCGVIVPPHNAMMLAHSIVWLHENPETTNEMGKRARAAYENKYTLAHAVRRFESTWGLAP